MGLSIIGANLSDFATWSALVILHYIYIYMDWGKFCNIIYKIILYKWYMYEHCLLRHWQRSTAFGLVYQWLGYTFIFSFMFLSKILESSKRDIFTKSRVLKWPTMSLSVMDITYVGDAYIWTKLLKFHWSLFQMVQLTITQQWFR